MMNKTCFLVTSLLFFSPSSQIWADDIICPPSRGLVETGKPILLEGATAGLPGQKETIYASTVVDYISSQICTIVRDVPGSPSGGFSTALHCRNLETLPESTKKFLRAQDCPPNKTP